MITLNLLGSHILQLIPVLQTGAVEKLIDELFNSTPGRVMFVVTIFAVISIPVMLYVFLRILQRNINSSATVLENALRSASDDRSKLITVIDGLQGYVNRSYEENSENYLMVKTLVGQLEARLITASLDIKANQMASDAGVRAIGDLLLQTTTLHAETRHDIETFFTAELQTALEQILDQRRVDLFEDFQAPAEDDCRYKIKLIRAAFTPLNPDNGDGSRDILLSKAPTFRDKNEAGRLRGSGEIVKIIEETVFPGWCYIRQLYGKANEIEDSRVAGYARLQSIVILDLPDTPNTIEGVQK